MRVINKKHVISARQARAVRGHATYDPDTTIVLTRRESLEILEMIENPPPRTAKFIEAMARYRKQKICHAIATLVEHADIEQCADTGAFVGKIIGVPGAHSQGSTREELIINLREVLEMLFQDATPGQARLCNAFA